MVRRTSLRQLVDRTGENARHRPAARGRLPLSGLEGRAATARAGHVWIAKLEPGAIRPFDIVNLGAVQVLIAERIDEQFDAVRLEQLIQIRRLVLEVQVILETGAATANDS